MRRLLPLVVLVSLAAACGGTVDDAADEGSPTPGVPFLALRSGATGPLTAYDSRTLGLRFQLPAGVTSADKEAHFVLRGRELRRYDPVTGVRLKTFRVPHGWRLAAVSATARWVALVRARTQVLVLDGSTGEVTGNLRLRGDFLVETIADDGAFLFLQQTFADGRYAVRGYDLAAGRLLPGSLATKGETVLMQGVAGGTVASPDGRWLLTLYVDTKRDAAFVHALNLFERFPLCIDMPPCDGCTIAELRRWSLTLAPDGRTLYAANPAIGRVAEVHLPTARVIYEARFPRAPGGTTHSAISPDGSRLLFTNGTRLWSYDTHRGYAETLRADAGLVADLTVSRDGARLFVTHPEGRPVALAL